MSYRVPCLGGNTLHADHTQYGTLPFSGRPTDDFKTIWPIGFSLDEIMQLAWRVRKWKITGTAAWSFSSPAASDSITYDESAQDPDNSPYDAEEHFPRKKFEGSGIIDERYLVSSLGPISNYIATPRVPLGGGFFFWRMRATFACFNIDPVSLQFPKIYYDSGSELFYPDIRFILEMGISTATGQFRAGMTSFLPETGGPLPNGLGSLVGTLTILGRDIELYSLKQLTGYGGGATLTTSGTFLMEPATASGGPTPPFWAFANSENLPIYDIDSGAQLNDPFG